MQVVSKCLCSLRIQIPSWSARVVKIQKFSEPKYKHFNTHVGFVELNSNNLKWNVYLPWDWFSYLYLVILQLGNLIPILVCGRDAFTIPSFYCYKGKRSKHLLNLALLSYYNSCLVELHVYSIVSSSYKCFQNAIWKLLLYLDFCCLLAKITNQT